MRKYVYWRNGHQDEVAIFPSCLDHFPQYLGKLCHFYILGRRHNVSVHFLYIGVDQDCLLFRANKRDVFKNKRDVLMFLRIRGMFLLLG